MSDLPLGGGDAYTEYGVLCDRRAVGLGIALLAVGRSIEAATSAPTVKLCIISEPHEHLVKERRVYTTDWREVRE